MSADSTQQAAAVAESPAAASANDQQTATTGAEPAAPPPTARPAPESDPQTTAEQNSAGQDAVEYADFSLPEGVSINQALLGEFKALAKGLGLKQAQAQTLADLGVKQAQVIAEKFQADRQAEIAAWVAAAKADKEFGGEKLAENLAVAKRALDAFATPELKQVLDKTGLGNHPELIRAFFKAGQLISEDRLVPGGLKPAGAGKSAAQVLYGK